MDFFFIMEALNKAKKQREVKKAEEYMENIAAGFWAAYHLALTWHGRYKLSSVIAAYESGDLELDPGVIGMYRVMLNIAPYQTMAIFN